MDKILELLNPESFDKFDPKTSKNLDFIEIYEISSKKKILLRSLAVLCLGFSLLILYSETALVFAKDNSPLVFW